MAGTPPEDLLEWLLREEEILGTTYTETAMLEYESARRMLFDELGYDPTGLQVTSVMEAAQMKYEILPQLGVSLLATERPWGTQYQYYDYATHRFVSTKGVMEAVRAWMPPPAVRPR